MPEKACSRRRLEHTQKLDTACGIETIYILGNESEVQIIRHLDIEMCTITQERFIYKNFNNQLQSSSIDSNNKTMLVISQLAAMREDIDHSVTSRALEWVFDQVLMRIWEGSNHVFNLVCESPLTPKLAWYLLTIALFLVVQYTVQVIQDCRTLPRGPFGLPIWGVLNFIKKPFHHYLWDKQKKYGKLYTCKMGQSLQVRHPTFSKSVTLITQFYCHQIR